MPELPEVETVRRQLHAALAGKTIVVLDVFRTGREFPVGADFSLGVVGKHIVAVERRAKLLIWRFVDGSAMVGHLKMTGKFLLVAEEYQPGKHDRMRFVTDGPQFIWSDVRQFGYVKLMDADGLAVLLAGYGPEPLLATPEELAERLLTPKTRKIKAALLDQTCIAGIGNIYADEACFRAGIRPTRRLGTLSAKDRLRLAMEVQAVLTESLAQNGTSSNDYVDTLGERGGFLGFLRVYGRENEPCRTCAAPIKKFVLAGRGTHYCAECQK